MSDTLTQDLVKELLHYDPKTGQFHWRRASEGGRRGRDAGAPAGYRLATGYWFIGLNGKRYLAHRVAWLYMTGGWPPEEIDHVNGNRGDNRFGNLRLASKSQNMANAPAKKSNKLGLRGVFRTRNGKYQAQVTVNRQVRRLGTFDTPEEARDAYLRASRQGHGEFTHGAEEAGWQTECEKTG